MNRLVTVVWLCVVSAGWTNAADENTPAPVVFLEDCNCWVASLTEPEIPCDPSGSPTQLNPTKGLFCGVEQAECTVQANYNWMKARMDALTCMNRTLQAQADASQFATMNRMVTFMAPKFKSEMEEQKKKLEELGGEKGDGAEVDASLRLLITEMLANARIALFTTLGAGLPGNLFVLFTVSRYLRRKQSATNVYIFGMALADTLLIGVCIPARIYSTYHTIKDPILCKTSFYLEYASYSFSVLMMFVMAIERYIGICYPLKRQTLSTPARARMIVGGSILTSFLLALPVVILYGTAGGNNVCMLVIPGSGATSDDWRTYFMTDHQIHIRVVAGYIFVFLYAIPLTTALVCYSFVAKTLLASIKQAKKMSEGSKGSSGDLSSRLRTGSEEKEVIRMLFTLTTAFALCWGPWQVINLWRMIPHSYFSDLYKDDLWKTQQLDWVINCIAYANSALNPMIYIALSGQFRRSFVYVASMGRYASDLPSHSGTSGTDSSAVSKTAAATGKPDPNAI